VYGGVPSGRASEIGRYPALMLSHACANCGCSLDSSTRSYSAAVRMWIAHCPRCGHAVRWNPRGGRAPFRLWARTRALNLRLGVALAFGQFAGLLASIYAAIIGNEARFYAHPLQAVGGTRAEILALVFVLGGVMAFSAAISAVNFAPHRGFLTRLSCAWLVGALPIPLALIVLAMTPQPFEVRDFLRTVRTEMGLSMYFAYLAIPASLSVIFALILSPIQQTVTRSLMRRHYRTNSDRLRGLARSTHHASAPTL
jgi:hypothetical protein